MVQEGCTELLVMCGLASGWWSVRESAPLHSTVRSNHAYVSISVILPVVQIALIYTVLFYSTVEKSQFLNETAYRKVSGGHVCECRALQDDCAYLQWIGDMGPNSMYIHNYTYYERDLITEFYADQPSTPVYSVTRGWALVLLMATSGQLPHGHQANGPQLGQNSVHICRMTSRGR